jgi:hypothetical protein
MHSLVEALRAFVDFLKANGANGAILGLFALAFIVTMPESLPASGRDIPAWCWTWLREGLNTFVSFRSPKTAPKEPTK